MGAKHCLSRGRAGRMHRLAWASALGVALLAVPAPGRAADGAATPPPGPPPIALVLPFANATGDQALDWIGIALQDVLNIDLWYVGALHTWDLPNMVGQAEQPPLAMAVDDPGQVAAWASRFAADLMLSGRYSVTGDAVSVTARLTRPAAGAPPVERTVTGALAALTDLAGKLLLDLLDEAKVPVGPEERARILIPKTGSVEALRANARGFEAYVRYGLKQDDAVLRESFRHYEAAVRADPGYAEAWNNLAWAQFVAKDYGTAVPNFERAIGLRVDLIDALVGLGKTRVTARPDDPAALPPLEAAVRLNPSLAHHRTELAEALEALGQVPSALRELQATERIVAGRIPHLEGGAHLRAGGMLFRQGDADAAVARFERARDVYRRSGSKPGEAGALRALGDLAMARRDFAAARRHYGEALALAQQLGNQRTEGLLQNALGMAALNGGDSPGAESHFDAGLKASRAAGDKEGQVLLLYNLGFVVASRGDLPRAQGIFLEALLLARQLGDQRSEAAIQERLKQIRDALGEDST